MFIVELGLSSQPLSEKYSTGSHWVTHSWIKSVWEKTDLFGIEVELGNIDIGPPRVGDDWLMNRFLRMGCSRKELIRLNRDFLESAHPTRTSEYGERPYCNCVRAGNTPPPASQSSCTGDTKYGSGDLTRKGRDYCISSLALWTCMYRPKCRDLGDDRTAGHARLPMTER